MTDPPIAPSKDRFTSLDTAAVAEELRALGPTRIDKVFDVGEDAWLFTLRAPGHGRRSLLVHSGRFAVVLSEVPGHLDELSPLAKELRRHLSGARLTSVREPAGERLLELEFRRADSAEAYELVAEFFGTGNLVLARGARIFAVAHPRGWAHRTLRVGSEYRRPPSRVDPWSLSGPELAAVLASSRSDLAHTLAARLALGGPLAEELVARSGINGHQPATEEPEAIATKLHRSMTALLSEVRTRREGYLYSTGDGPVDVEPFPSQRWTEFSGVSERKFDSFSEAALLYFTAVAPVVARTPSALDSARAALSRQREQQLASIAQLESEIEDRRRQADQMLAQYDLAEKILERARAAEGGVGETVEAELAGVRVVLYRNRTVRQTARALYQEMKSARAKLSGAQGALATTDERLALLGTGSPELTSTSPGTVRVEPRRKRHWFEQYRWFVSSEGILVIGGRDASSNDRIVRRYLGTNDRYVHADLHGAPSVVVKHPPPGRPMATEQTLSEAGQWGLAFSKAWRAGRASGDAFWVESDQVSKAGGSGEFVGRGAWVIHGTKHFLRDLPLELGIGQAEVDGDRLWSVAPPSALRSRGTLRFLLTPGDERRRANVEVDLARELNLSRADLQPLLPAGGLTVRRA